MKTTEMLGRRITLVGVRGIGKTTLLRAVKPELPHVEFIFGSSLLRELAGEKFHHFDFLPAEEKQAFREEAVRWMEQRQAETGLDILCDGHASLFDPVSGLVEKTFTTLDGHFFRELILLDSTVDVVLERRKADTSKPRVLDPLIIHAELEAERKACSEIVEEYDSRLHVIPVASFEVQADYLRELLKR